MTSRTLGIVIAIVFLIGAVLTAFVFEFNWWIPCIFLVVGVVIAANTPLEEPKEYINETPVDARNRANRENALQRARVRNSTAQSQATKTYRPQRDHLETDCEDLGADIVEEIVENIMESREIAEDRIKMHANVAEVAEATASASYSPPPSCASDHSFSSSSSSSSSDCSPSSSSSSSSDYSSSSSSSFDSGSCGGGGGCD